MYRYLRSLITYHNLTYAVIAKELGISVSGFSEKINGRRSWKYEQDVVPMVKLFRRLGETDLTSEKLFEIEL